MENRYMEVQSDRLTQDTEVLRGDIEKARQEMEALTELVASLHVHWEGAAAGVFGQRFAEGMTEGTGILCRKSRLCIREICGM